MFGTRLRDRAGQPLWGFTRTLFFGRSPPDTEDVRLDGPLEGFGLVPGLYDWDVYGGLLRHLQAVGGYRPGHDLFVLQYDWRKGIAHAAAALATLVDRLGLGLGNEARIDLLCMSSGGLVARYYMARGGTPLDEPCPEASERWTAGVRRVVYVGTPHRGTLQAAAVLRQGFRLVPKGKLFAPADLARNQITYDLLPHPADAAFVDEGGSDVEWPLFDARGWTGSECSAERVPDLQQRLDRARRLHDVLSAPIHHPDATLIAARNTNTRTRLLVVEGRVVVPNCCEGELVGRRPFFGPGDGTVPETSAIALPGHDPSRVVYVEPGEHRELPSEPQVHAHALEALSIA